MKLRYLYVDRAGQLRRLSKQTVQNIWDGERRVSTIPGATDTELRLVSVICDNHLRPRKLFVLRLPLLDGELTVESQLTLQLYCQPEHVTPKEAFEHHTAGWPRGFFEQIAVVMDVPCRDLNVPVGVGGPLLVAAAMKITPREAVRYLK